MAESSWTVLVPVEVLEGETIPEGVMDLLSELPVVILGYHVLPEQTPPGQARMQFEDQAQAKLNDLAAAFEEAGGTVETRLVFTHDEEQTLDRVADETGCEAILIPNPAADIERILVPVRGEVDTERIAAFVAALVGKQDIDVALYHVAEEEEEIPEGRELIDGTASTLMDLGIPTDAIAREVVQSGTPIQAIATAAAEYDAVVMGERAPSLRTFIFGEESNQIAMHSLGPVIVVRRERAEEADEDR